MKELKTLEEIQDLANKNKLVGFFKVSNDLYHEGPGLSQSQLKPALKSLKHFKHALENKKEQTPAMIKGSIVHSIVIDQNWKEVLAVAPEEIESKRVKAWKEFNAENEGKYCMLQSEMKEYQSMVAELIKKPKTKKILQGKFEQACYWIDPETKMLLKCKPDIWHERAELLADFKTSSDASPEGFMQQAHKLKYGIQAAFYLEGIQQGIKQSKYSFKLPQKFMFLVGETTAPYGVGYYELPMAYVENQRALFHSLLRKIKEAKDSDKFTDYSEEIIMLSPKAYQYDD